MGRSPNPLKTEILDQLRAAEQYGLGVEDLKKITPQFSTFISQLKAAGYEIEREGGMHDPDRRFVLIREPAGPKGEADEQTRSAMARDKKNGSEVIRKFAKCQECGAEKEPTESKLCVQCKIDGKTEEEEAPLNPNPDQPQTDWRGKPAHPDSPAGAILKEPLPAAQGVAQGMVRVGPTDQDYRDLAEKKAKAEKLKAENDAARKCRVCGCTDEDCQGCVERTGMPCHWVADDLCSACDQKVEVTNDLVSPLVLKLIQDAILLGFDFEAEKVIVEFDAVNSKIKLRGTNGNSQE